MPPHASVEGLAARFITESPEASLKRVGTDILDLLMGPHGVDSAGEPRCPGDPRDVPAARAAGEGAVAHEAEAGAGPLDGHPGRWPCRGGLPAGGKAGT